MYKITINDINVTLENNDTTKALIQLLPLNITMCDLNGNEKYYYLDSSLPTDTKQVKQIHAGDIMLFGDNCLVIFYKSFNTSYSYTYLGHLDDIDVLKLGNSNVEVVIKEEK